MNFMIFIGVEMWNNLRRRKRPASRKIPKEYPFLCAARTNFCASARLIEPVTWRGKDWGNMEELNLN